MPTFNQLAKLKKNFKNSKITKRYVDENKISDAPSETSIYISTNYQELLEIFDNEGNIYDLKNGEWNILNNGVYIFKINPSDNENNNHTIEFQFNENFGTSFYSFGHILSSGGAQGHFDPATGYNVMKGGAGGSTLQTGYDEDLIKKETKYTIITGDSGQPSKFLVNDVLESESGFIDSGIHYTNFQKNVIKTFRVNGGSGGFSYDPDSPTFIDESQGDGADSGPWPQDDTFTQDGIAITYNPRYGGGGAGSRLDKNCKIPPTYDGAYIGAYGGESGYKGTSRKVDSCTDSDINGLPGKNGGGGGGPGKVQYSNTYGIGGKGGKGISYFYFKLVEEQQISSEPTIQLARLLKDELSKFILEN